MTHARPPAFAPPFSLPHIPLSQPSICPRHTPPARMMADISKPRPGVGGPKQGPAFDTGSGGGVAVITKPDTRQKTKRKSKTEKEPSWRVLLHNDDVHTFDYVTGAIVKVRPTAPFLSTFPNLRIPLTYRLKSALFCLLEYRWSAQYRERKLIASPCRRMHLASRRSLLLGRCRQRIIARGFRCRGLQALLPPTRHLHTSATPRKTKKTLQIQNTQRKKTPL